MPKIHVKRPTTITENAPTTGKDHVDKFDITSTKNLVETSDSPQVKAIAPVKACVPPISFLQRLQKHKLDKPFQKFLNVFKKLHVSISFAETVA